MKNLFNFDYEIESIMNKDNTKSRFGIVYGENGNVIHTKKDSYSVVSTADFSTIGEAFIQNGYNVNTFVEKHGEVIGLSINLLTNRMSKVGDKNYRAVITVPNNGGGRGYLSINEVRLICTNGMTRSKALNKQFSVKIPHTVNYLDSINVMTESLEGFAKLVEFSEAFDLKLDSIEIDSEIEAIKLLNKWFWENEFPVSQKGDLTFDKFRELIAVNPDDIKCFDRYEQLMKAFNKELEYNKELNLNLSMYTVFATVTNYLSRRVEQSKSAASEETKFQRNEKKLEFFNRYI